MNEKQLDGYLLELARGRVASAKAAPMASAETIGRAAARVEAAYLSLRAACRQLDHLLGHPWRIGAAHCECTPEDVATAYANGDTQQDS